MFSVGQEGRGACRRQRGEGDWGGGRAEPGGEITGPPRSRSRGGEPAAAPALPAPGERVFLRAFAGQRRALAGVEGSGQRGKGDGRDTPRRGQEGFPPGSRQKPCPGASGQGRGARRRGEKPGAQRRPRQHRGVTAEASPRPLRAPAGPPAGPRSPARAANTGEAWAEGAPSGPRGEAAAGPGGVTGAGQRDGDSGTGTGGIPCETSGAREDPAVAGAREVPGGRAVVSGPAEARGWAGGRCALEPELCAG